VPDLIDRALQRRVAASLFNETWSLLEKADRTAGEDERMVNAAHASRYHWGLIGEPVNFAVGEWQISRVYAVLGRAEPALHHARRALAYAEQVGDPFQIGEAHEALARALAVAGDRDGLSRHRGLATAFIERIQDPEARETLLGDLSTLPGGEP